jgi:S-adenosylmethionine uptake transporter
VVVAAYRAAASAVVAPMQYSQILWAALAGHFMFDEAISATTWVGLAVIILSGTYILTSARTQDAAPQAI